MDGLFNAIQVNCKQSNALREKCDFTSVKNVNQTFFRKLEKSTHWEPTKLKRRQNYKLSKMFNIPITIFSYPAIKYHLNHFELTPTVRCPKYHPAWLSSGV